MNIVSFNAAMLTVESDGLQWQIPRYDIQAVRPAPETFD